MENQKENTSETRLTEEQLEYIIEESNLELNKLYIDFELLKRRIQRAEQEITQLNELLPKRENSGDDTLAEKQK